MLKMDIPIRIFGLASLIVTVRFGTIYIAFSEVLVGILGVILYSIGCNKTIGYKLKDLYWDFASNVLQALVMGAAVFGIGYLQINKILLLLLQLIVGGVVYVLVSVICKNENFNYLVSTAKEYISRRK